VRITVLPRGTVEFTKLSDVVQTGNYASWLYNSISLSLVTSLHFHTHMRVLGMLLKLPTKQGPGLIQPIASVYVASFNYFQCDVSGCTAIIFLWIHLKTLDLPFS
jgi:hypothetical protein